MRRLAVALIALTVVGCARPAAPPSIAVGATSAPESVLVAHLYAAALRFYGSPAHVTSVPDPIGDRKSTRLNSSHMSISYAVFCVNKKRWPRKDSRPPKPG